MEVEAVTHALYLARLAGHSISRDRVAKICDFKICDFKICDFKICDFATQELALAGFQFQTCLCHPLPESFQGSRCSSNVLE